MVVLRVGGLALESIQDDAFATVLEAASAAGGRGCFPVLFRLADSPDPTEPHALMDELARLAGTEPGRGVAMLIGTLRDDLMSAVAAAGEG